MKTAAFLALFFTTQLWAGWSVSTYNIRNFDKDPSGSTDLEELSRIIKTVKSDVMAFEEVVNVNSFQELIAETLPGYKVRLSGCGGFGKQNLAVVYNPRTFKFISEKEDLSFSGSSGQSCGSLRPVFFVTLAHLASGENYVFGVVHLKAGGDSSAMGQRWKQYKKLSDAASQYSDENLVLLGDFNSTGFNLQDSDYTKFEEFLGRAELQTMSEDIGCTNYWHGGRSGGNYQASVLDHIVLQEKNVEYVKDIFLGAHCAEHECRPATPSELGASFEGVSDHCPVQVTFK